MEHTSDEFDIITWSSVDDCMKNVKVNSDGFVVVSMPSAENIQNHGAETTTPTVVHKTPQEVINEIESSNRVFKYKDASRILKARFLQLKGREIEFNMEQNKLGGGTEASVFRVNYENRGRQKQVALRISNIPYRAGALDVIPIILRDKKQFRNVAKLKDSFTLMGHSKNYHFQIMEYCRGGDLLSKINSSNFTFEPIHMFQLANGLRELHSRNIAHRDIKPENILLTSDGVCKFTDFGFSEYHDGNGNREKKRCGSLSYVAPEVVRERDFDAIKTDIWSLGVTFFAAFTKTNFPLSPRSILNQDIIDYSIDRSLTRLGNDKIKELLKFMLVLDPEKRPDINEVLEKMESLGLIETQQINASPNPSDNKNLAIPTLATPIKISKSRPNLLPKNRTISGTRILGDHSEQISSDRFLPKAQSYDGITI